MDTRRAAITVEQIDETFRPKTGDEWLVALQSWRWRIFSGQLYKIMTKDDEHQPGSVVPFRPNTAQRLFVADLHYRNVILKARQLGFTTLVSILWLDHAMFTADQRVGIIAHSLDDAAVIFRDKVVFAYNNLPDHVRAMFPLLKKTESEMVFKHNNSAIRVATSMRSGTIHRLHISELGKIAAKFPAKANEIITGSLPAVPSTGIAIVESTAEGREGEFFDMATRAERRAQMERALGQSEWRFHFFPWWELPEYRSPANDQTPISAERHEYFDQVQSEMGTVLTIHQRRWYVGKLNGDMGGDAAKMWREYPSTPDECWRRTNAGAYFAPQIALARAEGRITRVPFVSHAPVHTFWDIGASDGTAIWLMQYVGTYMRFPMFIENWSLGYDWYVKALRDTGQLFGTHFLPHDAGHERQYETMVARPIDMLGQLAPDWKFEIVPRTQNKQQAIVLARDKIGSCQFDETGCAPGLEHLELYHKKWSSRLGTFTDEPEKNDGHSEAADAFMQMAQGFDPAAIARNSYSYATIKKVRARSPKGGMVA